MSDSISFKALYTVVSLASLSTICNIFLQDRKAQIQFGTGVDFSNLEQQGSALLIGFPIVFVLQLISLLMIIYYKKSGPNRHYPFIKLSDASEKVYKFYKWILITLFLIAPLIGILWVAHGCIWGSEKPKLNGNEISVWSYPKAGVTRYGKSYCTLFFPIFVILLCVVTITLTIFSMIKKSSNESLHRTIN